MGSIKMMDVHGSYPEDIWELLDFYRKRRSGYHFPPPPLKA